MWSAIAAFSACASGLMILMLLLLPETRGRSLADLDGAAPAALGGEKRGGGRRLELAATRPHPVRLVRLFWHIAGTFSPKSVDRNARSAECLFAV